MRWSFLFIPLKKTTISLLNYGKDDIMIPRIIVLDNNNERGISLVSCSMLRFSYAVKGI
jgi:hypothetical protein